MSIRENQGLKKVSRPSVQQIELEVPAQKIKDIEAEIVDVTYDIITDKIIVQGTIHKQIFFVGTDDVVHHQAEEMPFSTFIDVPGAQPGMEAQIHPKIEHIDFELSPDGTQLNQKVVLEIFVKITENVQVNLAETDEGQLYKLENVIGENNTQEIIESTFELQIPAIKIEDITAEITELETDVITDKVIIQGTLHKQIFFIGEDNIEYHQAEDVPFSFFVDIPGTTDGMNVQVHPDIELIKRELTNPTTLQQEVVIDFFVKVTESQQLNIAAGDGPLMKLDQVIGENIVQTMEVSDVTLERQAIKIKDIDASLRDITTKVINNKVIIQGTIHKQIFYVGLDDVEFHQAEEVSFSTFVDIPGVQPGMDVTVESIIEHIEWQLTDSTTVHQKIVIELAVKVTEEQQINVLLGDGPLIKAPQVVNEGIKQIIVEQIAVIPPVPPPLPIEIERALIKEELAEEVSEQTLVDNVIDLDEQAQKVRAVSGTVRNVTVEQVDDEEKVLVEGDIVKQIEYVDLDDVVRNMMEIVHFEELIEIPGLDPEAILEAEVIIEEINFSLINDGNAIRQVVILEIIVQTIRSRQIEMVTDVIGPEITTETLDVRAQQVVGEETVSSTLASDVFLDPPAEEIIEITGEFEDVTTEITEDQVEISGNIVKQVQYLDADEETNNLFEAIPFEEIIDITGAEPGMEVQVQPQIIDIDSQLSSDGTELTQVIEIEIFVKVTETVDMTVVTDVSGEDIEEVIKEIVFLDVINDENPDPVPVEVVVDVILA